MLFFFFPNNSAKEKHSVCQETELCSNSLRGDVSSEASSETRAHTEHLTGRQITQNCSLYGHVCNQPYSKEKIRSSRTDKQAFIDSSQTVQMERSWVILLDKENGGYRSLVF